MRLYLCEKPSQAKDIAAVLGASRRGDGCWLGNGVTVTWCIGHLLETAPPDAYDAKYKRWVLADLPIVPEKWKMRVKPKTASQYKAVKRLPLSTRLLRTPRLLRTTRLLRTLPLQ